MKLIFRLAYGWVAPFQHGHPSIKKNCTTSFEFERQKELMDPSFHELAKIGFISWKKQPKCRHMIDLNAKEKFSIIVTGRLK
jgi:hypothetical protein